MKKLLVILLSSILLVTTACAANTSSDHASVSSDQSSDQAEGEQNKTDSQKSIVIYFSASGNTKAIAEMIAGDTGADTFEIQPEQPYTNEDLDWTDPDSRVNHEHDDSSLQKVAIRDTDIPEWDSYSTVFIGYPIWWQDASWVVKSFVRQVDFTGKTVLPFCTSISSPLGESANHLAALSKTGDWQQGIRFSHSAANDDVQAWLQNYGF